MTEAMVAFQELWLQFYILMLKKAAAAVQVKEHKNYKQELRNPLVYLDPTLRTTELEEVNAITRFLFVNFQWKAFSMP